MAEPSLPTPGTPRPPVPASEEHLLAALQRGDQAAFEELVHRYHSSLIRFARAYLPDPSSAEEAVQETWLALIKGIHRFEGRSSLKTWLFRVLTYQSIARSMRERHSLAFSDMEGPSLPRSRFHPEGHRWEGHWVDDIADWHDKPEDALLQREVLDCAQSLIDALPPRQRAVIVMRDIEGLSATDICSILGISVEVQRVLLHRARSRVREGLARYLSVE